MSSKERNRNKGESRGRSRRGGRRSTNRQSGRPINRAERLQILDIWYQINPRSRSELLSFLGSMMNESSSPTAQVSSQKSGKSSSAEEGAKPRRQRPWERDILKDIPSVRAWGEKPPGDRASDTHTTKVVSILTGVIARGRSRGLSDQLITDSINENINDLAVLRSLFPRTDRGHTGRDDDGIADIEGGAVAMDTEVSQDPGASSGPAAASTPSMESLQRTAGHAPGNPVGPNQSARDLAFPSHSTTHPKKSSERTPMSLVRWGDMSDDDDDGSDPEPVQVAPARKRSRSKDRSGKDPSRKLKQPPKGGR